MKPLTDLTAHCIRCGFCLEACPTFVLTGEETESPRGRIYLIRSAEEGTIDWEDARAHVNRCLGCRACETACPSGVEYGAIFEIARDRLEQRKTHHTKKALLRGLTSPVLMRLQLKAGHLTRGGKLPGTLSWLLSHEKAEANKPEPQALAQLPPQDERLLPAVKGEVYLLEGCVMRMLFPRVHQATRRLLRRVGYRVKDVPQGCCGSLHLHAGYMDEARSRAAKLVRQFPGDLPIILDSAGCGSTMKEYDELLGSPPLARRGTGPEGEGGEQFAHRVFDATEFLLSNGLTEQLATAPALNLTATYHDACHLANGQRITSQPRQLLAAVRGLRLIELNEADMCCGSAGIYNLTQPKMARQLLERKWSNIEATGAQVAVMGNPGCHAWIAQAAMEHGGKVKVLHTVELLEAAFSGIGHFS